MQEFAINWLAVIVVAVGKLILGAVWYSPMLFRQRWLAHAGIGSERMREGMPRNMAIDLIANIIMAFVLVHAVHYAGATSIAMGGAVGVLNWLGFVAAGSIAEVTWAKRPFGYWLINNAYAAVSLIVMGAILAVWV